jgi:hypothetical protein
MAGLIVVGLVFVALGWSVRFLARSQRWVHNVVTSQNRRPWFVPAGVEPQSKKTSSEVRSGFHGSR